MKQNQFGEKSFLDSLVDSLLHLVARLYYLEWAVCLVAVVVAVTVT